MIHRTFIGSMTRPIMRSIIRPIIAAAGSAAIWILAGGVWDDTGTWDDTENWKDS